MHINNTLSTINHPKSILIKLKNAETLPFKDILSSDSIAEALCNIEYRERFFTPDLVIFGFLSQVLSSDKSCQAAVARILAYFLSQGKKIPSANTAAYSKARSRLSEEIISKLANKSADQLEKQAPSEWLWRQRHIKLIDGSTLFMPDTAENQDAYPQSKNQKVGLGFPIARIVAIISYATGAVLDVAVSCCFGEGAGEHSLLRKIMHVFKPGDIALADCYYSSYFLMAKFIELKVDAVFPIHNGRHHDFRKGNRLGKKDHIVKWKKPQKPKWMSDKEYDEFPDNISVREVATQQERKGFKAKERVIVTTLLDSKSVRKDDLKIIYNYRWSVEIDLKSIKDTMRMGILRGKTPEMVRKEIWMHMLAYNLIRKIIAQAANAHNKNPRELSFKLTLQLLDAFLQARIYSEIKNDIHIHLLKAIAHKKIGNRKDRQEPRRLKRRPKNYPLLMKPRSQYQRAA